MEKIKRYRSTVLYGIVGVIAILLLINVGFIYRNSLTIEHNKKIQEDAERAKVSTLDIIRNLHLLDIGIRGYALSNNPALLGSSDSAKINRNKIFVRLEAALLHQNYTNMQGFQQLRDSTNSYFKHTEVLLQLIKEGNIDKFKALLNQDRGYGLWLMYKKFSAHVYSFENELAADAKRNYEQALRNSYLLQALIFLLAVPSLLYMAYYSSRTFQYSEQLRHAQENNNKILQNQNALLDRLVKEKTEDVLAQNEEISSQNEEISAHNDQLIMQQQVIENAKAIIEEQAQQIQRKNVELQKEVERQTKDLRETNTELVEHNNRLEQFSYIISHNLRAPLARVQGLASLLHNTQTEEEKKNIHELLIRSSHELDAVITDISLILSIQKSTTEIRSHVSPSKIIKKVLQILEPEIHLIKASVKVEVDSSESILSLSPYVESIFYNLISNAIKYRNPERSLELHISSKRNDHSLEITVSDNGLGIDLAKYNSQLFNLYKRFHLHVEGKGLGLYLVRTQIEALGGSIKVKSEVGLGTSFTLFFKL